MDPYIFREYINSDVYLNIVTENGERVFSTWGMWHLVDLHNNNLPKSNTYPFEVPVKLLEDYYEKLTIYCKEKKCDWFINHNIKDKILYGEHYKLHCIILELEWIMKLFRRDSRLKIFCCKYRFSYYNKLIMADDNDLFSGNLFF